MLKNNILITSDLHFDNKPSNEYRWGLFPWLQASCQEYNVSTILIGGDLFHNKDSHPASLVNRFVDNLTNLLTNVDQILMLKGNHDLIEHSNPYLRWINNIPRIKFFIKPETAIIHDKKFLFLPNSIDPIKEWQNYIIEINQADFIIAHQTFEGSISETGFKLSGISQSIFKDSLAKIYCGDIHHPQKLGKVTYIGTPYPINFGEISVHRSILLNPQSGEEKNLFFKTVKKHTIDINSPEQLYEMKINKHDQVKIRLVLDDIIHWEKYKQDIIEYCATNEIYHQLEFVKQDSSLSLEAQKAKLKILTPREILRKYCEAMKVGEETMEFGMGILEDQTNDYTTTLSDRSD